ncbi:MAG: helix-turn-helix domain-containing protein [Betaproteobacteria bacterium]|nr:helix-turn-helix domain-containing protein [Betaproteobacteria bacterium]
MTDLPDTPTKSSIQVIDRMMSLVAALARHSSPANLKQLAAETRLHPSTAHRILAVMVENRLVDRIEPGTYRLGIRLLELGNLVRLRLNVRQEALPHMQRLHDELKETVNLSVRQGDEVVYVERVSSMSSMMRVVQIVGTRAPLHVTAVGKVFLAEDGSDAAQAYAQRAGLTRFTDSTLADPTLLDSELAQVRARGFAIDREEAEKGVSCIGAGIRDDDGRLVAGLSVSAPTDRLDPAWSGRVRETAEQISRAIGYAPRAHA